MEINPVLEIGPKADLKDDSATGHMVLGSQSEVEHQELLRVHHLRALKWVQLDQLACE